MLLKERGDYVKKKIPALCLVIATMISIFTIVNIESVSVITNVARNSDDVFLKEVRKPDGSGYIFDNEDGINLSLEK